MNNAKKAIFAAIGKALPAPASAPAIAAELTQLRARIDATRPERVSGPPDEVFLDRVQSPGVAASAERIGSLNDLPAAVMRYAAQHDLALNIALQPHPNLEALNWSGLQTRDHVGTDETLAVGLALGGIAETGSLVFHSSPESPTLFAFLPLHHIVAVSYKNIWPWMEDYVRAFTGAPPPRNVNLVTGASGTTDIEGTLVRGAHGPGWLHVVMVGPPTD
ncbi:MAG: LUD domain-containing protein [Acidocella sp.]|nr:LUD domain-containing protein [Acidocella sp.]